MPTTPAHIISQLDVLLEKLKKDGFSINVQTYKDVHELGYLLQRKGNVDQDELKQFVSAIVCKKEEEQERFGGLFNDCFKPAVITSNTTVVHKRSYLGVIVAAVAGLLLVIAMVWWYQTRQGPGVYLTPEKQLLKDSFYYAGSAVPISLDSVVSGRKNISDLAVFSNEQILNDTQIFFTHAGRQNPSIYVKAPSRDIDTFINYPEVYIAHREHLIIQSDIDFPQKGQTITYYSSIDTSIHCKHYWLIDGDTIIKPEVTSDNVSKVKTVYSTFGNHLIEIGYDIGKDSLLSKFPPEFYRAERVDNVEVPVEISFSIDNTYGYNIRVAYYVVLAMLILFFIWLYYILINIGKKKEDKIRQDFKPGFQMIEDEVVIKGENQPYEFPFRSKEKTIGSRDELAKIARELKKQIEGDVVSLDVKKTISKAVRNLGLIKPVEKYNQQRRQYLFLVNRDYANGQQLKLFWFLAKQFIKEQVSIDFYFYNQLPEQFYQHQDGIAYTVTQLQDMHYDAILVVMSNGYEFLSYDKPEVDVRLRNMLQFWDRRVLVTPVAQPDWGAFERYLKAIFSLAPADIEGLRSLVQLINNEIEIFELKALPKQYQSKFVDFYNIAELDKYLGNELQLQWVCALACFPRIDWEVILAVGHLIMGSTLSYPMLLKLVRIDWIQKGSMTTKLRLGLLKKLSRENELETRKLLNKLLNEQEIDENMFAYQEKRSTQIANNFVLYAANEIINEEAKRDHDIFLKRFYQQPSAILDFSLKKYLEKEGDWETPVVIGKLKVGIQEYVDDIRAKELTRKTGKFRSWRYAMASLIIGTGIIAFFLGGLLDDNILKKYEQLNLVSYDMPRPKVSFLADSCSTTLADSFKNDYILLTFTTSSGSVMIKRIDLSKSDTIAVEGDSVKITGIIRTDTFKMVQALLSDRMYKITVNKNWCVPPSLSQPPIVENKDTLVSRVFVQYYPERTYDSANSFRDLLAKKYNRVENGIDKKTADRSEIRYYLAKDKTKADSLAQEASVFFRQTIRSVKLNGEKKQIEVWIKGTDIAPNTSTGIYIIMASQNQRPLADSIKKALARAGINNQTEILQADYAGSPTVVMYFNERLKDTAMQIDATLKSLQIYTQPPVRSTGDVPVDPLFYSIRLSKYARTGFTGYFTTLQEKVATYQKLIDLLDRSEVAHKSYDETDDRRTDPKMRITKGELADTLAKFNAKTQQLLKDNNAIFADKIPTSELATLQTHFNVWQAAYKAWGRKPGTQISYTGPVFPTATAKKIRKAHADYKNELDELKKETEITN